MSARHWSRAKTVTGPVTGDTKPNMSKRFGFKETREDREMREAQEKQNKWQERLQKEDLAKLEVELDALTRARFLAPQQKVRKNLVEKMVRDLKKQERTSADDNVTNADISDGEKDSAPRASRQMNDDDDEDGDILRNIVETETLNTSQLQFVPRKVSRKQNASTDDVVMTVQDHATLEEQKLLKAIADNPDDFDDILDSI